MPRKKKTAEPLVLEGIGVSPGVVTGHAYLVSLETLPISGASIAEDQVEHEICRLEDALVETRRQIRGIQKDLAGRAGTGGASVLDAHLLVLDDRAFIEEIILEIRGKLTNAENALRDVSEQYGKVLFSVRDDYLRERVADIKDVSRRLIRNLMGGADSTMAGLTRKHIIVAQDLPPSITATLRRDSVLGFATDLGSPTSHTAVMARALEIPAIVGLRDVSQRARMGDEILIDGNKGILIIHPTARQLDRYGKVADSRRMIERGLESLRDERAETRDGRRIVLSANVGNLDEIAAVKEHGAEGVGLFRSEYAFIARDKLLNEEEQTELYTQLASALAPAPVIIRTLDIGGDKLLAHDGFTQEANPFLGCRSIRLSLLYPEHFKVQLRAILRASARKNLKIMYPMIGNLGEVARANELLAECKAELTRERTPFHADIEVGAMIEIPSAALTANMIAEHVKFFSLGTNDLVQYTLAVDRVNERVAYLYEPTHPAVLELIRRTIEAGHRHKLWVGLCGEMAADPMLTMLLLGMGVDELSVAPAAVPIVKDAVRRVTYSEAQELARIALTCRSGVEVLAHCRRLIKKVAPELLELN
ncbi:MAG: phosphoenolpyruvate--protein phosphotransferase [Verrucomicrobiota bacterium]|nr:phosphoenolpyruvate--protein phosphotransferase [Verrucomicrobiota bacterium]